MPPAAASARARRPRELTGRGLPEVDVRDLQGIGVGERGTFDIRADAGPVLFMNIVPVMSLTEVKMPVKIAPPAPALNGVTD